MLDVKVKTKMEPEKIVKAVDKAAFRNFGHAAAGIRKTAQGKIEKAPVVRKSRRKKIKRTGKMVTVSRARTQPSRPGTPPHTRRGQVRRAITFDADKTGAVIGPRFSVMGTSAEAHELGGNYKGSHFDERPFMRPSLEENAGRFARDWQGSVVG